MHGASSESIRYVLAADIGVTYSRFAVYDYMSQTPYQMSVEWLRTSTASDFGQLVEQLIESGFADWFKKCTAVVIAVPGPVTPGEAMRLPKINWIVSATDIKRFFPVVSDRGLFIVNDFVAQSMTCLAMPCENSRSIQFGRACRRGPIAAIGLDSAFGACSIAFDQLGRRIVVPSEIGHQPFPFHGTDERRFEDYIISTTGRSTVDLNTVVSGSGLVKLNHFLTGRECSGDEVLEQLRPDSDVCRMFATFIGRAAQTYALSSLPTGGLFLTGNLVARWPILVDNDEFRVAFHSCEYHQGLLQHIPICLVTDETSALKGAAHYAWTMLN